MEINIYEKLCVSLVIYKDHTEMHGQHNIKFSSDLFCLSIYLLRLHGTSRLPLDDVLLYIFTTIV